METLTFQNHKSGIENQNCDPGGSVSGSWKCAEPKKVVMQ